MEYFVIYKNNPLTLPITIPEFKSTDIVKGHEFKEYTSKLKKKQKQNRKQLKIYQLIDTFKDFEDFEDFEEIAQLFIHEPQVLIDNLYRYKQIRECIKNYGPVKAEVVKAEAVAAEVEEEEEVEEVDVEEEEEVEEVDVEAAKQYYIDKLDQKHHPLVKKYEKYTQLNESEFDQLGTNKFKKKSYTIRNDELEFFQDNIDKDIYKYEQYFKLTSYIGYSTLEGDLEKTGNCVPINKTQLIHLPEVTRIFQQFHLDKYFTKENEYPLITEFLSQYKNSEETPNKMTEETPNKMTDDILNKIKLLENAFFTQKNRKPWILYYKYKLLVEDKLDIINQLRVHFNGDVTNTQEIDLLQFTKRYYDNKVFIEIYKNIYNTDGEAYFKNISEKIISALNSYSPFKDWIANVILGHNYGTYETFTKSTTFPYNRVENNIKIVLKKFLEEDSLIVSKEKDNQRDNQKTLEFDIMIYFFKIRYLINQSVGQIPLIP